MIILLFNKPEYMWI